MRCGLVEVSAPGPLETPLGRFNIPAKAGVVSMTCDNGLEAQIKTTGLRQNPESLLNLGIANEPGKEFDRLIALHHGPCGRRVSSE